jgi:hypothetical protein
VIHIRQEKINGSDASLKLFGEIHGMTVSGFVFDGNEVVVSSTGKN